MKRLLLFLLSLAVTGSLYATAQIPDVLTMDGKTYSIFTNPLTPVLAANPERLPQPEVTSTGLWRGYIAHWSVRDARLYLDDVKVPTKAWMDSDAPESEQFRSAMKPLFGADGQKVAAWFTGHLIVPTGEIVDYVHMGYASTYSSYLVLKIIKGEVQQKRALDAAAFQRFRRTQYEAFKKTPEYAEARALATKASEAMSDELTEDFLFQFTTDEHLSRIFDVTPQADR